MIHILIIDDEDPIRNLLARMVELEGYQASKAADCRSALKMLNTQRFEVVLCDVFLPDGNGVNFIFDIHRIQPDAAVILLTAHGNIPDGVQAIKNGAFDYITKGDDNRKIIPTISRAIEESEKKKGKNDAPLTYSFQSIVGQSECLQQAISLAQKVAKTDVPILLTGETGTGKEVFAHAIHTASARSQYPIVEINCSAFSKDLLESELFGYKAGAFTGAVKDKKGLFEIANHGTIFLDEIGEMAFDLQARLLRVLETGEYIKIGDTKRTQVDVRIISATNRHLKEEIEKGGFREDLFYRLSVFQIHLPALRERKEDLEILARHFFKVFSNDRNPRLTGFSNRAMQAIKAYEWPGNVRELINRIRRAMVMSEGRLITPEDLDLPLQNGLRNGEPLEDVRVRAERDAIHGCLQGSGNNISRAARDLGVSRMTLYRLMEKHCITP